MQSNDELRKNVQYNLYRCRIENGLTQEEVGTIVNLKKTTVASWEQGKSVPDIETFYRLTKYYGKTMEYMYANNRGQ